MTPVSRPRQDGPVRSRARGSLLTGPVLAWGLWDWGSSAFNAVITTFVFSVYLTGPAFGDQTDNQSALSLGLTVAGVLIALLAPVAGQRADRSGGAALRLGLYTAVVVLTSASLFLIRPEPRYLWAGVVLLGVGNVFFELASVSYNSLLPRLTTRERVGAVSGLGWGMGYLGGIVLLLIVFVGLINPEVGWFGVTSEDGMSVRVSMLVAAAWFGVFSLPVLLIGPGRGARRRRRAPSVASVSDRERGRRQTGLEDEPPSDADPGEGVLRPESLWSSYRRLWRTLAALRGSYPEVLWFLLASAVLRDGLAGVFTYGGIIAQATFGFSGGDVIVFAIAANVVAGVATIASGWLDDRLGPRRVILGALAVLVIAGVAVFLLHDGGPRVFWALGLVLSGCVGPAQSASRSFLARLTPEGREGEVFGLYATTGRAVSFLAPAMYGLLIAVGRQVSGEGAGYWGILGIVAVLLAGLLLMLRVRDPDGRVTDLD